MKFIFNRNRNNEHYLRMNVHQKLSGFDRFIKNSTDLEDEEDRGYKLT